MTVAYKSDFKIQEQVVVSTVDFGVINMHKIFELLDYQGNKNFRRAIQKRKQSSKGEKMFTKIGR